MSERIDVVSLDDCPPLHFAIEALAAHNIAHPDNKVPMAPVGYVDVEFKINGVEVCFSENIIEIYNRFEEDLDKRAAKKALELFELIDMADKLNDIQMQYSRELKRYLAKKLGRTTQELFGDDWA